MTKPQKDSFSSSAGESLCCCEYQNMHGEKSHVLASCCDCEALDETFDRIFKCEKVPDSTIDRLINTISDRCRIPSCFGGGAVQLRPDVVAPVLIVPTCLCLATLHPVMTVVVFLFMPLFVLTFHALWRRQKKNRRTYFFYYWGITSVISCYCVFQFFVVAFREVLLWEILTVFTCMMVMFYFLHLTKQDPDSLLVEYKSRPSHKRTASNDLLLGSAHLYDQVNDASLPQGTDEGDLTVVSVDSSKQRSTGNPDLPARAGYCKICEAYIAVRDHHCIWIDSCVGGPNHRSFLLAMIMFVFTGLYAAHLTFTTICTPKMYYDWFLLPNDCRWLYVDFLTAICFVTAVYCVIVSSLMCLGLTYQFILISQNVTSHELVHSHRQGLTRCGLYARDNPYNKGFLRNWMEFWFLSSRAADSRVS
ncbi:palmitoyltransferase ZDHHC23-like [Physella acuta]|uniref:palmitoyltransferase ZDHHC23-like n=1 Tax=Physella acuta TaxID=109671 RepID=UPI0027DB38FF|nr:palmitoyltransferase ZDHHC23-like [Physella acuta]